MIFEDCIFLGNGKASEKKVEELHALLDRAISILGGIQQPPMSTDKNIDWQREIEEGEAELKEVVSEINVALLGK
jgi:hypothetical protein